VALIAFEVLKVVAACHSLGILHGDIKPANFVLKHSKDNPVMGAEQQSSLQGPWLKAIDFGCGQVVDGGWRCRQLQLAMQAEAGGGRRLGLAGLHGRCWDRPEPLLAARPPCPAGMLRFTKRSGTPVYMAPEIYQRNYSYEADVWSLGIMLYQLVTRRFPFWDTFDHCQVLKLEEVRGGWRRRRPRPTGTVLWLLRRLLLRAGPAMLGVYAAISRPCLELGAACASGLFALWEP
jgi:calcium-dependent protein kinase